MQRVRQPDEEAYTEKARREILPADQRKDRASERAKN